MRRLTDPAPQLEFRLHQTAEAPGWDKFSIAATRQVQFRLRQIVEAPGEEKEQLLQELETFAFRGIPDVRQCKLTEHDEQELTVSQRLLRLGLSPS